MGRDHPHSRQRLAPSHRRLGEGRWYRGAVRLPSAPHEPIADHLELIRDDFEEVIATTTLMVIGQAGFGQRIKWPEVDSEVSIPFYHALRTVLRDFIPKLLLPEVSTASSIPVMLMLRADPRRSPPVGVEVLGALHLP